MRRGIIAALVCAAVSVTSFDAEAKRKRFSLGGWSSNKTTESPATNRKLRNGLSVGGAVVDYGTNAFDGYDGSRIEPDFDRYDRKKRIKGSVKRGECIPGLPKSFELHAIGVYEGTRTPGSNLRIGRKNKRAEQVDVYVSRTARPAVIVLGAYEPIVWAFNASEGSNIAGVLVRGFHSQAVSGLPEGIPVMFSTRKDRLAEGCGSYGSSSERKHTWTEEIQTVFGRSLTSFNGAYRGKKFAIGRWTGLDAAPPLPVSPDEMVASGRVRQVSHSSAGLGGGMILLMLGGLWYMLRRRMAGGIIAGVFGLVSGL